MQSMSFGYIGCRAPNKTPPTPRSETFPIPFQRRQRAEPLDPAHRRSVAIRKLALPTTFLRDARCLSHICLSHIAMGRARQVLATGKPCDSSYRDSSEWLETASTFPSQRVRDLISVSVLPLCLRHQQASGLAPLHLHSLSLC